MKHYLRFGSLLLYLVSITTLAQDLSKYRDPKSIQMSLLKQGIVLKNAEARLVKDSADTSIPPADSVACDVQPVLVSKLNPQYPSEALDSTIQGNVFVKMWIDTTGSVRRVRLVKSDDSIFNVNTMIAAFNWRFKPALSSRCPVDIWITVPFRFAVYQ